MAQRRMFSKTITNSDPFLDMSVSSQALYFHLGMNADDDGFVQSRSVMRQIGSTEDDLKLLIAKGFLIKFADGVIVITAWKVNNEIRLDRYKPTFYKEHLKALGLSENKMYLKDGIPLVVPNDNRLDTQVRLGKVRLDKVSKGKERERKEFFSREDVTEVILKEISDKYGQGNPNFLSFVKSKFDDVCNWEDEKPGRMRGRNWKLTLINWVKRDALKIRKESYGQSKITVITPDPSWNS